DGDDDPGIVDSMASEESGERPSEHISYFPRDSSTSGANQLETRHRHRYHPIMMIIIIVNAFQTPATVPCA
ncbi:MAG TPA: hypothetical protein VL993_01020, partial [Stellaceae bacterium]|nr:hypothetical protein [Stellaceae bacterium]